MKDLFATIKLGLQALQVLAENIDKIKALLAAYQDIQNQLHANREELNQIVANLQGLRDGLKGDLQGLRDTLKGDSATLAGLKTQLDQLTSRLSSIIPGWRP